MGTDRLIRGMEGRPVRFITQDAQGKQRRFERFFLGPRVIPAYCRNRTERRGTFSRFQVPLLHGRRDQALGKPPQYRRSFRDFPVSFRDLPGGDAVPAPGVAFRQIIVDHRLQPVEGSGEFRFRRLPRFKFPPQGHQKRPLVIRQQAKDPPGGPLFPFGLVLVSVS